jgi:protein-disulfide isomerase
MMVKYPGKIKLIHRHFPMDHEVNPIVKEPLHPGSGKMAMLTIYAASQNKFWQMSDLLFSIARVTPKIRIKELADKTGLNYNELSRAITNREIQYKLKKDILDGLKLGITGTPSFVIDGNVYHGQIPQEFFIKLADE